MHTLAQIVESAYGWANGDVPPGTFMEGSTPAHSTDFDGMDGLLEFLLRELAEITDDHVDPPVTEAARWEVARRRADMVLKEVLSVHGALHRYGPGGVG